MNDSFVHQTTLDFLKSLKKNNNREWFLANKSTYEDARTNMIHLADNLLESLNSWDEIETPTGKSSLFRIHNDVRFKKDKSPYKSWMAMHFVRAGKERRGGYYLQIKPGDSFMAVGFWAPEPGDLKRIREDIAYNTEDWRKMLKHKDLYNFWGGLKGELVATAPKGYPKDHPAIDLLKYKQYIFSHSFSDKELQEKDLVQKISRGFKASLPFLDFMSDVLTTDGNGVKLT
jgi:uncharacterized protein (TIGR02453 family)